MQRRELLGSMLNTALAMGLLTPLSLAAANGNVATAGDAAGAGPDYAPETAQWLEQQLRELAARDSSEQSVPMFLALEDLAPHGSAASLANGSLNPELTARFEHYADLLLQFKSNPDESDAVGLIVLMARRGLVPGWAEMCW